MRVLFVIPGEAEGSSMIFARRQAECLARNGVDVASFYLRSRTSPRVLLSEWRRFRRELARVKPAIVHAHFGTVTAMFAALGVRLSPPHVPLVITFRGGDLNPGVSGLRPRLRAFLGRLLSQFAALFAARIVCVSRQLRDRLWWRRDRVIVLASGVDPDVFVPEPRAAARARLGWPDPEPVVLFNAGHDPAIKRLDLANGAIGVARRTLPSLRFEILNGSAPPALIPTQMNAADCLLVASDSEGSPTVVQEALACGLPVVSVAVGDVPQRLCGVSHTRIVERDPEALGRAVAELVSPPRRTNGRKKIAEFSSAEIAERLKAVYQEIAARPV